MGRKLFTCVAKRGEGEGEGKRLDYVGLNAHEGREGNVHGICACVPGRVSVRSPSYSQWCKGTRSQCQVTQGTLGREANRLWEVINSDHQRSR